MSRGCVECDQKWDLDILLSQPLGFSTDNPEGVACLGPGLPYSATLGHGVEPRTSLVIGPNPEGVASCRINLHGAATFVVYRPWSTRATTPLGLGSNAIRRPKVAEYSNLGLRGATPLGLKAQTSGRASYSLDLDSLVRRKI